MIVEDQSTKVAQRRAAMPVTSAFIDQCRATLGTAFVDAQMAQAQEARREYARVLAEQGEVAAKRWHRINANRCTFYAEEGGRVLGMHSPFGQSN